MDRERDQAVLGGQYVNCFPICARATRSPHKSISIRQYVANGETFGQRGHLTISCRKYWVNSRAVFPPDCRGHALLREASLEVAVYRAGTASHPTFLSIFDRRGDADEWPSSERWQMVSKAVLSPLSPEIRAGLLGYFLRF